MEWVRIFSSQNAVHAEIVKGVLMERGINVVLQNKQDSNYLIGFYEIHVPHSQLAEAEDILKNEISFR